MCCNDKHALFGGCGTYSSTPLPHPRNIYIILGIILRHLVHFMGSGGGGGVLGEYKIFQGSTNLKRERIDDQTERDVIVVVCVYYWKLSVSLKYDVKFINPKLHFLYFMGFIRLFIFSQIDQILHILGMHTGEDSFEVSIHTQRLSLQARQLGGSVHTQRLSLQPAPYRRECSGCI